MKKVQRAKKSFDQKLRNLHPEEKAKLEQVESLGRSLMAEHQLEHYRFKFSYGWTYKGMCRYNSSIILALNYVLRAEMHEIRNTILHEIAHAIVGPQAGHRLEWQLKARELGVTWARKYRK
jgi:hypothetical protein